MIVYLNYFKLRIITNFQYRASAIAGILTQLFFGIFYIMLYLALYESNNGAETPMDLNNLITYMWLNQAFFSLIYPFFKDVELLNMIKNGNLAYEFIRPQNFYIKYFIKILSSRIVACFLRCLPILIIGMVLPYPYKISLPVSIHGFILFIISLLFSSLLVTGLSLIIHIITIYLVDHRGVVNMYTVTADLFSGGFIPLPFLPNWLKKIAYVLPFRYLGDLPFRVYSGDIGIVEGRGLLLNSILWTFIFFILGYLLTKVIYRKLVIQGG